MLAESIPALIVKYFSAFQHGKGNGDTSLGRSQWKYNARMITSNTQSPRIRCFTTFAPQACWSRLGQYLVAKRLLIQTDSGPWTRVLVHGGCRILQASSPPARPDKSGSAELEGQKRKRSLR